MPGTDCTEILQFVVEIHRTEMERHQKLIGNIFYWTLTIILALGVATIQLAGSQAWHLNLRQWPLKVTISAVSCAIALLAIAEILKRLAAYDTNARVVVRASKLLHLFDSDTFAPRHEPLYDAAWLVWGDRNYPAHKFLPTFHAAVLLLVAAATTILAWSI